jgi:hypothetical protein
MLYDPRWDGISLASFAAWLEKQPAHKSYRWLHSGECACGQYANSVGIDKWMPLTGLNGFWRTANHLACERPHTFGGLLARVRNVRVAKLRGETADLFERDAAQP